MNDFLYPAQWVYARYKKGELTRGAADKQLYDLGYQISYKGLRPLVTEAPPRLAMFPNTPPPKHKTNSPTPQ